MTAKPYSPTTLGEHWGCSSQKMARYYRDHHPPVHTFDHAAEIMQIGKKAPRTALAKSGCHRKVGRPIVMTDSNVAILKGGRT